MFLLCVDVCTVCVLRNTLNMCWMRLNSVFFLWKKKKEKKSNAEIVRHIRVRDYPRHCKAQRKQKSQICIKRRRQIARKNFFEIKEIIRSGEFVFRLPECFYQRELVARTRWTLNFIAASPLDKQRSDKNRSN